MADKRELILQRLEQIMLTIPGIAASVRNRGLRSNESRPAIVLLDADEERVTTGGNVRGRARMVPQIMRMRPEIYILMKEKRPTNEEVGQGLNVFRNEIVEKVSNDPTLISLVGSNGGIVYEGFTTDLKSGSWLSGEARLDFSFNYLLDLIN